MKAFLCICLLLVGHFIGLRHVFAALDWLGARAKDAYAAAAPELDRMQREVKREYQEARRAR